MLQRFPVESKGRRKKLQEVICYIHCLDGGEPLIFQCHVHCSDGILPTDFPTLFPASTGWLCDHNMFLMLLGKMCNGESPCIPNL